MKIVLVDDKEPLLKSISRNLLLFSDIEIVFTAINGQELLDKLALEPVLPDAILLDIEMPIMDGIKAAAQVFDKYQDRIKIVMLTIFDQDDKIFEAIKAGASGYLMKDEKPEAIVNALRDVLSGGSPMSSTIASKILALLRNPPLAAETLPSPADFNLTKRETEILILVSKGISYRIIADQLFVSDKTVKKHVENIYTKLHVQSKYEAMVIAQKYKWGQAKN